MTKPTAYEISTDDLTRLYNEKCELHALVDTLTGIVHPDHIKTLNKAIKVMDTMTKPMLDADDKERSAIRRKVNKMKLEQDIAVYSTSADPTKVIHHGVAVFEANDAWVQEGHKDYKSNPVVNPTVADAFKAFRESIQVTGDTHHVFFEGITKLGIKNGVMHINLESGS
jgi:hypothetical protein